MASRKRNPSVAEAPQFRRSTQLNRNTGSPRPKLQLWAGMLLLIAVTAAAYYPAWHGGKLWDDDRHMTRPDLRSADGLRRIWFELGATQQYYPLIHTAFWLQHRIWGDNTSGYHFVNIVLHALAAFLVGLILRRLSIPGAYLAAMLFALHPIQVESVAWITELKNTLSGVLYLGSAWFYLSFDEHRKQSAYAAALALFILALLCKSVTATLPAVLLVIFWWRRGTLDRRRDVAPLLPWLVIGAVSGLFTAWVERTLVGAQGADYQLSLIERFLVAGRVVWFYLGKLLWPHPLIFIYPRWEIRQDQAWQYLFPLALAVLAAILWRIRGRSRAPLAALLIFCGSLFPALGFIDVFPFRYSFVADHFQYLAGIAVFALVSAGAAKLTAFFGIRSRAALFSMAAVPGIILATATFSQSRQYQGDEILYRSTIRLNPGCWMAHNNLGNVLQRAGRFAEAITEHTAALRWKPDYAEAYSNLGNALQAMGRVDEAYANYVEAVRLAPNLSGAQFNLANALHGQGRLEEAVEHYRAAIRIEPGYAEAHGNLGSALDGLGHSEEGLSEIAEAIRLRPDYAVARNNMGKVLQRMGRLDDAVAQHEEALRIDPNLVEAYNALGVAYLRMKRFNDAIAQHQHALQIRPDLLEARVNLGNVYLAAGRIDDAIREYRECVRLKPDLAAAHFNLGNALQMQGHADEAILQYREAIRLTPAFAGAHFNLAQVLQGLGRLEDAIHEYREVVHYSPQSADARNNLGVALAVSGRPAEAAAQFQEALRLQPDYPGARQNLARVQAMLKNR